MSSGEQEAIKKMAELIVGLSGPVIINDAELLAQYRTASANMARPIAIELLRLHAEREADRALMREALEAALHVTDCANRNEYGDVVLTGSLYNPEHLDAAISKLRARVG